MCKMAYPPQTLDDCINFIRIYNNVVEIDRIGPESISNIEERIRNYRDYLEIKRKIYGVYVVYKIETVGDRQIDVPIYIGKSGGYRRNEKSDQVQTDIRITGAKSKLVDRIVETDQDIPDRLKNSRRKHKSLADLILDNFNDGSFVIRIFVLDENSCTMPAEIESMLISSYIRECKSKGISQILPMLNRVI